MSELTREKTIKAAIAFLNNRGYQILGTDYSNEAGTIEIIAEDEDDLVFVQVPEPADKFPRDEDILMPREKFENIAIEWLMDHHIDTEAVTRIRLDVIAMVKVWDNKAIIRHHRNALQDIEEVA